MKVPFTWKVTGWFMVGWSPEFPIGEVRPLRYFGEDPVAYRDESGKLHVLEAHCKHLGAHLGHVPPWLVTESGPDDVTMEDTSPGPMWAETAPCTAA